jgi:hypothetical protein
VGVEKGTIAVISANFSVYGERTFNNLQRIFDVETPPKEFFNTHERYDCVVDASGRFWRVQVKSSAATHYRGFSVRACWRTSHRHVPYSPKEVDFLVVFISSERIWYVIPIRALGGRLTIHLYPFGSRKDGAKRFEKYREAWHLLGPGRY